MHARGLTAGAYERNKLLRTILRFFFCPDIPGETVSIYINFALIYRIIYLVIKIKFFYRLFSHCLNNIISAIICTFIHTKHFYRFVQFQ